MNSESRLLPIAAGREEAAASTVAGRRASSRRFRTTTLRSESKTSTAGRPGTRWTVEGSK